VTSQQLEDFSEWPIWARKCIIHKEAPAPLG
jgi:hypothetical protein